MRDSPDKRKELPARTLRCRNWAVNSYSSSCFLMSEFPNCSRRCANHGLFRANAVIAIAFGLALVLGAATTETTARPAAGASVRLYVPNQMGASVSVLDGAGTVLETVDLRALGFGAHAMPHQVAAEPNGGAWFVTLAGDGWVLKFDAGNRLLAKTKVNEPGMVVLDPARDRLYVSRALGAVNPARSLAVLRASDLELLDEPDVFIERPHALAVDTVSGRVYTGSLSTSQIAGYDPESGHISITTLDGPPQSFVGLATSPDGRQVVATTQLSDRLLAFDASDRSRLALVASVEVGPLPYDVAFSPDGKSVWFPNQRAGTVTRVDSRNWAITAVVRHPAFQEPHGVVVTADSRTVYVSSHGRTLAQPAHAAGAGHDMNTPRSNGTVAVIDAASGEVTSVTEVGPYAAALGLTEAAAGKENR